jgi:hypothetical protein
MPIFCNSINKVLAALALESDYVWRPARNHPSGSDTAGKLGSDRGAAVAFEKHFTFSPFALRDQIRPQLAIYLSERVNVKRSQISRCCRIDPQIATADRPAAILAEADARRRLRTPSLFSAVESVLRGAKRDKIAILSKQYAGAHRVRINSGLIRDQPDALILEQCVAIRLKHIDTQLHCAPRVRRNYNRCKSEKNPVSGETHQF